MSYNPQYQDIEECLLVLSGESFIWPNEIRDVALQPYDQSMILSLGRQLANHLPFTEKQSVIGIRLVKKYEPLLKKIGLDTKTILSGPVFRWPFRTIDKTKSLYIDGESIVIKSPFIPNLVNTIKKRKNPSWKAGTYNPESKEWEFDYNESNVDFLMNAVKGMNFKIDGKIQEDFEKIKLVKENALKDLDMLKLVDGKLTYRNTIIDETDLRKSFVIAKSLGCTVYDDNLVKLIPNKDQFDKILYSDSKNHYVNKSKFNRSKFNNIISSSRKIFIMLASNNPSDMEDWVDTLLEGGINATDICVCFRYKNNNEANEFIKNKQVNTYDPTKKVFILSERIPKPIVKDMVRPDMVIVDLPTTPSHYKTKIYLENKSTVVYYCATKPSGVDNCADV